MAGTATAVTNGDVIPLLDDNGSGQYVKGRNNARDIRIGLLGSLYLPDTDGFTPRAGVLNTNDGNDLIVLGQVSPNQTVRINSGRAILPRTGQGSYLFYSEAMQTVNMPAASAVNFRTDIVCAMAGDLANFGTDAAHGPQFWVEQGALGGGVPATPTGMLKLAEVFRAANDNTISTEIANKRISTALAGAVRQLFPEESSATAGIIDGELRDTGSGTVQRWMSSTSTWVDLRDLQPANVFKTRRTTNLAYTNTETVGDSITFTPRAGRVYEIKLTAGSYSGNNTPSAMLVKFRSVAGTGPITTGSTQRFAGVLNVPNGLSQGGELSTTTDAAELGTAQITVGYTVQGAAGNTSGSLIGSAANHETTFKITDVT
jgi:hypothetical protein